ncbi:RNA polymerase sigma factor [Catellatospora methionotrophica]|uniref:RNA polymerase sigma factor n=1 Tax=Catellatospora methionotrophica TaxID=121620 RepID=UPI0033FA9678
MTAQDELGELYHAGYRRLVAQVYAFTTDLTEAQDAVQEAFARALARRHGLSDVDAPEAWLRTVAINVVRRRWRRRQLLDTILLRERPLTRVTAAAPEPDNTDLRDALATIPSRYREVIVLHYLADLPLDEVAELLEVPVGTVKSRLSRGRDALRGLLDDVEAPPLAQVQVRAGRIKARRRTAQAASAAAVLLIAAVGVFQPWRPQLTPDRTAASPSAPVTAPPAPVYSGAGLVIDGIFNPATAPDVPGSITEFELGGSTGWLRTACTSRDLPDCEPAFARTADGGQTWQLVTDTGAKPPAPPGDPGFAITWAARGRTPSGLYWVGGMDGGTAYLASTADGVRWQRHALPGAPGADRVTATVRGEDVLAFALKKNKIIAVYAGRVPVRVSDGAGFTPLGEPVYLPDGRILTAGPESRFYLSTDLGATFTPAGGTLPTVGELRATSDGYVALDLFRAGWVAISPNGLTWHKLPIR